MNEIRFDSILPMEVPVFLGAERYVLKEPTGEVTDKYKRGLSAFAKVDGGKVTVINPQEAVGAVQDAGKALLADCLYDPKGNTVGIEFVRQLPGRVRDPLIEAAIDLSGLRVKEEAEEAEEDLKNSSSGTMDGSASPTS